MENRAAGIEAGLRGVLWALCGGIALIILIAVPAMVLGGLALLWGLLSDAGYRSFVAAAVLVGCAGACLAVARGLFEPPPRRGR